MTREERLDWLCRLRSEIYVFMPKEWLKPMDEALTDSIKALEQEPCEDCISREKVFDMIDTCNSDGLKGIFCSYADGERFKEYIKDLPSVQPKAEQEPKTEWIPVTERLPKEGEEVLVWYEYDRYGDYNCRWQTCGLGWQRNEHFYVDNDGFKPRVIAWCELPKPYSEVEQ